MDSDEFEIVSLRGGPPRTGKRPMARRRRLLLTLASAFALTLAVSGLLLSTQPNPRLALAALLGIPSPTPTATLALGDGIFFVAHRAPWGVLTVDGRRNDASDILQTPEGGPATGSVSFLLARGHHQITYDAPPFRPLHCVVSVPAAAHDTCPLAQPDAFSQRYIVGAARIIDLGATLANLPAQPMADLVAAATSAITITTPPVAAYAGEHFRGADYQIHFFAQDAQATLFREPWMGTPLFGATGCRFLCPDSGGSAASAAWGMIAYIRQGYHFTAAGGDGSAPPDTPLTSSLNPDQSQGPLVNSLQLWVTWDGSWHVALDPTTQQSLSCQAATEMMSEHIAGAGTVPNSPPVQPLDPIVAANQAAGCLTGVQQMQPDGSLGPPIRLLYRFGLLLVLDAAGRAAFPDLPQANAKEEAIAQQILAHTA
jgi:hypothetical protein